MKNKYIQLVLVFFCAQVTMAQFNLDGQFRPRTEYRHGYGNILADGANAGFAISTRIRLNAYYEVDSYQFYLSLPNQVRLV